MARQTGIIKLQGTLGGLTFYERNGVALVKEKCGVEKKRILNDPAFKRTRENMSEFGASAMIAKDFRQGLLPIKRLCGGRNLVGKITQRMKQINVNGSGIRGKRSFEMVKNKYSLIGLELHNNTFDGLFLAPYSVVANADKNQVTLQIPQFTPSDFVHAPKGATHFNLFCNISVLSDYVYDDELGKYVAVNPNESKLNNCVQTGEIIIGENIAHEITIPCSLPNNPVLDDSSALIVCIGIEFLQLIGAQYYPIKSNSAVKVLNVF